MTRVEVRTRQTIGTMVAVLAMVLAGGSATAATVLERDLPLSTQGPLWPPSEFVNEEGDFILVGQALTEVAPGVIVPLPDQAVVVSNATVPPLDADGREDFTNPFGATYDVVRPLDLSPGSPDLDMVLYTSSFGPAVGAFGGGMRIPALGDSPYNLNPAGPLCPGVFPTSAQDSVYTRPSTPVHRAPVWGFQGDAVAYDAATGIEFDPYLGSGANCGDGCPGENVVDRRRRMQITLGEYLEAEGTVRVELVDFDETAQAYTAAEFHLEFNDLLPNSLYTIWAIRTRVVAPLPIPQHPDPLAMPNVFVTDAAGHATFTRKVPNPFPDPALDAEGYRIIGLSIGFHSDFQSWGACTTRLGPGVDIHAVFNTMADGTLDLTDFVTVAAQ